MVAVAVVDVLETDAALRQRVSRLLPPGLRTGFPSRAPTAARPLDPAARANHLAQEIGIRSLLQESAAFAVSSVIK